MNRRGFARALAALVLAVGGFVAAGASLPTGNRSTPPLNERFVCPLTGEELPCPKCCPLREERTP